MPAAIPLIAAVVGSVISGVDQNVQNKAAIKNNENQQKTAIANAQGANAAARGQVADFTAANPVPNAGVARPNTAAGAVTPSAAGVAQTPQQIAAMVRAAVAKNQGGLSSSQPVGPQPVNISSIMGGP